LKTILIFFFYRVSDEKFWKNYFYNVELIKMKHAINAEEEAARRENGEGYIDEDDILKPDENEDEVLLKQGANASHKGAKKKEEVATAASSTTDETSRTNEPDFEIKIAETA